MSDFDLHPAPGILDERAIPVKDARGPVVGQFDFGQLLTLSYSARSASDLYWGHESNAFLLLNLAFGFYNVGTIWAHEIDIFRSWKLLDPKGFHEVQRVHWRKFPYWIFTPVGLSVLGSIALIWYHPTNSPLWGIGGVLLCQVLSIVLTAVYWGRWQAQLAQDPRGSESPHLAKILKTHWVRTLLVNASAMVLLVWAIMVVS